MFDELHHWPVVVSDSDTPTLFVFHEGTTELLSIERLNAGLVVISYEEARRLAKVLETALEELKK